MDSIFLNVGNIRTCLLLWDRFKTLLTTGAQTTNEYLKVFPSVSVEAYQVKELLVYGF